MAIITLTTDFGLKDHYASAVKGAILTRLPQAAIIDISHQIEKFNIQDASFILKAAYPDFPPGTIHIIGLITEYANAGFVALEANGHYFIGADNGIFSLLFDETPSRISGLFVEEGQNLSFPVRDIFAKAACDLASGASLESLGIAKDTLLQRIPFRAASMGDNIRGSVIYVDSFGN
nr:SAM-dependent chlorinase/fluorinase [Bacteroidota bacterium]